VRSAGSIALPAFFIRGIGMDKIIETAVRASMWMFVAWLGWLGFAGWIAVADRINLALHEHLCEAPKRVVIVVSRSTDGGFHRRRECKEPAAEVIRVVRNADGQLVRAK